MTLLNINSDFVYLCVERPDVLHFSQVTSCFFVFQFVEYQITRVEDLLLEAYDVALGTQERYL